MSDSFYRAFEEKFRGSRELIKTRLRVYLPFVEPLIDIYKAGEVIDLGCGRGEWLELLQESGFDPQGVDLDDGMLAACRELGLKVHTHDAIVFLKNLPDASQVIVSGFHIVEHIPFSVLQILVQEALRVLKPGGLLILETPNPENIVVGASDFYLDPTHQRPIPPGLLAFLPEHFGFKKIKVLRLQESAELSQNNAPNLLNVLNGASPDFAVVAQKDGPVQLLNSTKSAFDAEYGLTLETLANRFQQQTEARATIAEAEARAALAEARTTTAEAEARAALAEARTTTAEAEARAALAEARTTTAEAEARAALAEARTTTADAEARATIAEAEARAALAEARIHQLGAEFDLTRKELHEVQQANQLQLEATRKELHDVHQSNHHHWQLAETRQQHIQSLLNSTSWRITAPMRWIAALPRQALNGITHIPQKAKIKLLAHAKLYINRRPRLKRAVFALLSRFPSLKMRLKQATMIASPSATQAAQPAIPTELANLTPHARHIYTELQAAIKNRQKENV